MDPILEKVTANLDHSFALKEDILPHIEIGWHFHPEYELTLIAESYGGGPVGVETLSAALSEARDAIEEVIEPFLLQRGL